MQMMLNGNSLLCATGSVVGVEPGISTANLGQAGTVGQDGILRGRLLIGAGLVERKRPVANVVEPRLNSQERR